MPSLGPAVVFDFDGALRLARLSWQTADELARLRDERGGQAAAALVGWSGAFGTEFVNRIDAESQCATVLVELLRDEAAAWAEEWRRAMDQENWNRYQAACARVRDDRSVLDRIGGFFAGHDDLPPTPADARLPAPPTFSATRSFADYSRY